MQTDAAPAFAGHDPRELASAYGTPLLAIDLGRFDRAVARFSRAGERHGIDVAYAAKAFLVVALARHLAATTLALDVCSLGELLTAEAAGFPAERLLLHGCGKTDDELAAAVAGRVGRIVVDSLEELRRLCERADERRPLDTLLRLNPGIAVDTHAFVRTAGDDSKFGFAPEELEAAALELRACPGLRAAGIHVHLGSQIAEPDAYLAALDAAFAAAATLTKDDAGEVIVGGGFGIDEATGEDLLDVDALFARLRARADELGRMHRRPAPRIGVEPGRALIAAAGTSLYRVVATKTRGARRFAIVDGSIADNPRPALYGAHHPPRLVSRESMAAEVRMTICGRSCESDELAEAALPEDLAAGDLVALATTGAYTYSMASNYNRFARPAVVFLENGARRLAARRERPEELLARDVMDPDA